MNAYIIDATTLLVPFRAEAEDVTVGDGMVEVGLDHPDFAAWLPYALPLPESWRRAEEERRLEAAKTAEVNARRRAKRAAVRAAQQSGSMSKANGSPSRKSRRASSLS